MRGSSVAEIDRIPWLRAIITADGQLGEGHARGRGGRGAGAERVKKLHEFM